MTERPFHVTLVLVAMLWLFANSASAMLHPQQGRFMQRDPWIREANRRTAGDGYQDGMGLYEYVGSQPLRQTDWSGKTPRTCQVVRWLPPDEWRKVAIVPGNVVGGTNSGSAPIGGRCANRKLVYARRYLALTYCCDETDAGYFKWWPHAQAGEWKDTGPDVYPVLGGETPIPIPLGYGQAVDLSSVLPTPCEYAWSPPAPASPAGAPQTPTTVGGIKPLDNPGKSIVPLVRCSAGPVWGLKVPPVPVLEPLPGIN